MPQIHCILILGLLFVGTLQPGLFDGDIVVTVTGAERVYLRSLPEIRPDSIIESVPRGVQFRLIEENDRWFQVVLPDGGSGWINKSYGKKGEARELVRVNTAAARIRSLDNVDSEVLGEALRSEAFPILGIQGNWIRVELDDGREGWIREDLLTRVPLSAKESETPQSEENKSGEDLNLPTGESDSPETIPGELPEIEDLFLKAQELTRVGNTLEAIETLEQILQLEPDSNDAIFKLGQIYMQTGDLETALGYFQRIENEDPLRTDADAFILEIDSLLDIQPEFHEESSGEISDSVSQDWQYPDILDGWAGPIIIGFILTAAFLISGFLIRRRRMRSIKKLISPESRVVSGDRRSIYPDYLESKKITRILKDGQVKRDRLDQRIQKRFSDLQEATLAEPTLPDNSNNLVTHIESFKISIDRQEKKIAALSDILTLQNEKLESLEAENRQLSERLLD